LATFRLGETKEGSTIKREKRICPDHPKQTVVVGKRCFQVLPAMPETNENRGSTCIRADYRWELFTRINRNGAKHATESRFMSLLIPSKAKRF